MIRIPKKTKPDKSINKLVKRIEILEKRDTELRRTIALIRKGLPEAFRKLFNEYMVTERVAKMSEDKKKIIYEQLLEMDFIPIPTIKSNFKNPTSHYTIIRLFEEHMGLLRIKSTGGKGKKAYLVNINKHPKKRLALLVKVYNDMMTLDEARMDDPNPRKGMRKCNLKDQLVAHGASKIESEGLAKLLRTVFVKNGESKRIDKEYNKLA